MSKTRLEAFSDGVFAILITILVLELKIPHGHDWAALRPVLPTFLVYVLSFVFLGIYWNNHHHMLHATHHINGWILWANLHLLFWLSLVPFCTGWLGESSLAPVPTAVYGAVMFCAGVAYLILEKAITADPHNTKLKDAVGNDLKGGLSAVLYASSVAAAFYQPWISAALYVTVALMWFVPDRRIEKQLE